MNLKEKLNADELLSKLKSLKADGFVDKVRDLKTNAVNNMNDFRIEKLSKISKKTMITAGGCLLGAVVLGGTMFALSGPEVYKVSVNGKDFAYIEDDTMLPRIEEAVSAQVAKDKGVQAVMLDKASITCTETDKKKEEVNLVSEKDLQSKLALADIFTTDGWAIQVDGKTVAATATEEEANQALNGVKAYFQKPGTELLSASFKEAVVVTQSAVKVKSIMPEAEAVALIMTGTEDVKKYEAKSGDTVWDIAVANGMSVDELIAANPGFDASKLKIGQELNLVAMKPYVTVQTVEKTVYNEDVPFGVTYEASADLYQGQTKIKAAGGKGVNQVTAEVTKENGQWVSTKVLSTASLVKPATQTIYLGTKAKNVYYASAGRSTGKTAYSAASYGAETAIAGSGTLGRPVPIHVSSAYGSRGSGRHTGVDLRNPRGTAILAAEAGTVTCASYKGSAGNIVKISHGNGLETWYEHCDTMNVKVGQKVAKGQQIATVGMTGRATGYHLHFEVRINGVTQNPLKYL